MSNDRGVKGDTKKCEACEQKESQFSQMQMNLLKSAYNDEM